MRRINTFPLSRLRWRVVVVCRFCARRFLDAELRMRSLIADSVNLSSTLYLTLSRALIFGHGAVPV
jgi:hypothetical protein